MFRSYLLAWLLFLLPGIGALTLNFVFLRNTGELLTPRQIVERQNGSSGACLYGTAIHDDTDYYKLEGYAFRKPDVAVLGSSRVLQLQEKFFTGSFYNMGGTMADINQGEHVLRMMLERHKPKLLLLGVDFWWFNDTFLPPKYREAPPPPKPRLQPEHLFAPFSFLWQGKLTLDRYLALLLQPQERAAGETCALGINASITQAGYRADGSYDYGRLLSGKAQEDADVGFADTLKRIRTGTSRFQYGEHVNAEHLAHFLDLVRTAEAADIPVIVFFPPLAPTVERAMENERDRYRYIAELRGALRKAGVSFQNLEDPATVSSIDCEFIDGFHGGAVTAARVVLTLAERDARVRPFVDVQALEDIIRRNQRRASLATARAGEEPETDFLNIGCAK